MCTVITLGCLGSSIPPCLKFSEFSRSTMYDRKGIVQNNTIGYLEVQNLQEILLAYICRSNAGKSC